MSDAIEHVLLPSKRKKRPDVWTDEIIDSIAEDVANGMTEGWACAKWKLNVESLYARMKDRPDVRQKIKQAQAQFMSDGLKVIKSGVQGWQGVAWILERRHKDLFSRYDTKVEVNNTTTNTLNSLTLSPEILDVIGTNAKRLFGRKQDVVDAEVTKRHAQKEAVTKALGSCRVTGNGNGTAHTNGN